MYLNWIKITERAADGIKIINQLDDDVFTTVIKYVHKNMSLSDEHADVDDDGGLEKLEQLVQIDRTDFLLLIKTLSYILKRATTFVMKPTKLQSELKEKLQLHEAKIEIIMKMWIKNMKPILDNLENKDEPGQSNQLEHIGWKLKMQLSSEPQQKEKIPIAQLQLHTTADNLNSRSGEPINFEINHAEVLDLYNQIDAIQNELDSLRTSK